MSEFHRGHCLKNPDQIFRSMACILARPTLEVARGFLEAAQKNAECFSRNLRSDPSWGGRSFPSAKQFLDYDQTLAVAEFTDRCSRLLKSLAEQGAPGLDIRHSLFKIPAAAVQIGRERGIWQDEDRSAFLPLALLVDLGGVLAGALPQRDANPMLHRTLLSFEIARRLLEACEDISSGLRGEMLLALLQQNSTRSRGGELTQLLRTAVHEQLLGPEAVARLLLDSLQRSGQGLAAAWDRQCDRRLPLPWQPDNSSLLLKLEFFARTLDEPANSEARRRAEELKLTSMLFCCVAATNAQQTKILAPERRRAQGAACPEGAPYKWELSEALYERLQLEIELGRQSPCLETELRERAHDYLRPSGLLGTPAAAAGRSCSIAELLDEDIGRLSPAQRGRYSQAFACMEKLRQAADERHEALLHEIQRERELGSTLRQVADLAGAYARATVAPATPDWVQASVPQGFRVG